MKEPTQKQLIERWENVLRVLQALTPHECENHWNMSVWARETDCGTVACAAGHCGLDPWFRRRGLRTNASQGYVWYTKADEFEDALSLFFGDLGTADIFYNDTRRPVSTVIGEVKAHIKHLRTSNPAPHPTGELQ